jgi:hypothetical protein
MIRAKQLLPVWLPLFVLVGCSRTDGAPAFGESQAAALPAPVAAPVDAAGPNRVVDPSRWTDTRVRSAYTAARRYASVIDQLYCHCKCKENIGHRSLLECFESDHGSMCDVCMTEALIAARMTEAGRTPKEIQKAIDAYYVG